MIIFIDPFAIPGDDNKSVVTNCLTEGGFICDFVPQRVEKSISWSAGSDVPPEVKEDIESEHLALLSSEDAVKMIKAYHDSKQRDIADEISLTEWVQSIQLALPGKNLTVFIIGLNKYYSNQKLSRKQAHREAVTGKPSTKKKKIKQSDFSITWEEAEEVFVEVQILTGCVIQQVETYEEMAQDIKRFSKSVLEKHKKKNRLDSDFSFTNTNGPGVSVGKTGEGLVKVWKHQLSQFNNFGSDMAEAIVSKYPSPYALAQACSKCETPADVEHAIGDINVRRGAGVIATNRRIGKEHARRIHAFITYTDPDHVLK